jgi:hypothetical protein
MMQNRNNDIAESRAPKTPSQVASRTITEREAFEAWALKTHGKFALDDEFTGAAWDAWQARAALRGPGEMPEAGKDSPAQAGQDDLIARCKRIMALIDAYMDRPTQHTRGDIRAALMDELRAPKEGSTDAPTAFRESLRHAAQGLAVPRLSIDEIMNVYAHIHDTGVGSTDAQDAEPVAEVDSYGELGWLVKWDQSPPAGTKLYTHPSAQDAEITDEQIERKILDALAAISSREAWDAVSFESGPYSINRVRRWATDLVRAILATRRKPHEKS